MKIKCKIGQTHHSLQLSSFKDKVQRFCVGCGKTLYQTYLHIVGGAPRVNRVSNYAFLVCQIKNLIDFTIENMFV